MAATGSTAGNPLPLEMMNASAVPAATGEMSALLMLAVILLAGVTGGWLARLMHMPGVTGNILAGALLGPACLDFFHGVNAVDVLQPLSTFAMGLIAVAIGGHLSYRRIHNALRRIVTSALCEVAGAVLLVTAAALWFGTGWTTALLLGTIAAATAPATTVALIRENRAKGTFVKTLLSVVALDNILCIILFAFAHKLTADYFVSGQQGFDLGPALLDAARELVGSAAIGLVLGYVTERVVHSPRVDNFSTVVVAILMSTGLGVFLNLNPLLTSLFFGVYLGNSSKVAEEQLQALEPIELLVFTCFFTLAGLSLHLESLMEAGALCVAYLLARSIGKGLGAGLGGWLARSSRRIWSNMPLGLIPQAGVAIGLVVLLEGDPRIDRDVSGFIGALILGAVTVNEIVGPFFTRAALRRVKEAGLDRPRVIEFLQEEYILTDLEAQDKWDALKKLSDFLVRTHRVPRHARGNLYDTVIEREKEGSTAIGSGVAIPHGRVESGDAIQGVLGISRTGIDFEAPDGQPVHLIMLIVTPREHEKRHLEVMASLASMVSDEWTRTRLIAAISANDAWEVIEGEEMRPYNYFLEQETT